MNQGGQHIDAKGLLQQWQRELATSLIEGFRHLLDSSSEVLLEFADSTESGRLQSAFYDAQREFYLKRESVINEFERGLNQHLLEPAMGNDNAELGADTLSLVEKDEYEQSLALETIAQRATNRNLGELHALAQRLSALLSGRSIGITEVPGHPSQVVRLFDPASRRLEIDKEVRLVFYTLFDRYVMSRLDDLYSGFNKRLIDLGVLPNIKFEMQRFAKDRPAATTRRPRPERVPDSFVPELGFEDDGGGRAERARAAGRSGRDKPAPPTSTETLTAISKLLVAKRRLQREQAPPLQTSVPITPDAADVGEAITDQRVLQEAPHPVPIPSTPAKAQVAVDATLLKKVKNALEKQRRIIKSLVGQERLDTRDEDVIDIVGMLFEAMLNEEMLPNTVKTLLSHLHTRYLKIAVQSPSFLDDTRHPARQLFEGMIDAGIRWVREDNLRAGIYPLLQRVVQDLLQQESLRDDLYRDAITEIDRFEQKLAQQSAAAEDRTLESERGKARLEQAKAIVQRTIMDLTDGAHVSPAVTAFVATTFADYLTLLLLRAGLDTRSEAWDAALAIGRNLVTRAVQAAQGQPPTLAVREEVAIQLQDSVGSLIPHHEQSIRRVIDQLAAPLDKAAAEAAPAAVAAGIASPAAEPESEVPFTDEDRALAEKLMHEAGSWFVMQRGDDGGEQRVKLLWVNPHTRNLLFVDQHGAKVALMPALTLAQQVRTGEVRPVRAESTNFVARSLQRIRRTLEASVNG